MIAQIKGAGEKLYYSVARAAIIICVVIACTATTVAAANNINVSYVYSDNEMTRVVSFSSDVDDILNKANVELGENDVVDMTYYNEGEEDSVIYVYRACEVTVKDGEQKCFVKMAGTVGEAVEKAGVKLNKGDKLNYDKDLYVTDGMVIEVKRAFGVTVKADSKTKKYMITEGMTVAQVLENAGITLGENDIVNKSLVKTATKGMKITVKRVVFDKHKETETIPFETVTKNDNSMYSGQTKVLQQGVEGKQTVVYYDKYVDGKLVSSEVLSSKVKKEPKEKIVAVGVKARPVTSVSGRNTISELTPPSSLKLDKNGRPTEYKRVITGMGTAYSCGSVCSTGVSVKPGRVAVNPSQIPYGTKMYIVSSDGKWNYGYAVAADTGGFAWNGSGTIVDLFMWSESSCVNFGRRSVDIYIL